MQEFKDRVFDDSDSSFDETGALLDRTGSTFLPDHFELEVANTRGSLFSTLDNVVSKMDGMYDFDRAIDLETSGRSFLSTYRDLPSQRRESLAQDPRHRRAVQSASDKIRVSEEVFAREEYAGKDREEFLAEKDAFLYSTRQFNISLS